jgi:hypothetical protein
MTPDQRRLVRLKRLERLRAVAKDQAALAAAEAEETLTRLGTLSTRTRALAASYAGRQDLCDGQALAQAQRFVTGLAGIEAATCADATRAASHADECQRELAEAERRRSAVEDRLAAAARLLSRKAAPLALGSRRTTGTGLEE